MLAWEWTLDKARDGGEEEKAEKKKAARKISQTAQVQRSDDAVMTL